MDLQTLKALEVALKKLAVDIEEDERGAQMQSDFQEARILTAKLATIDKATRIVTQRIKSIETT